MYIPGNGVNASKVRTFKLELWTSDLWAWIDKVFVYNGNDPVYNAGLDWSLGWSWRKHRMDKKYVVKEGISISLRVNAEDGDWDVDEVENRFAFGSFCALFEDLP